MKDKVVIIGSGLGGLVCAYILLKNGYEVVVLEKNAQTGGCLQTFVRGGAKFETGMHYIGSMDEGQVLHGYFKYLGLLSKVKLRALDPAAYDTILLGGVRYPCAVGRNNFIEQLARFFPKEKQNLCRYYDKIDEVIGSLDLYQMRPIAQGEMQSHQYEYISTSASDFIEHTTSNPVLRNVLLGNLPLYGGRRGKTSLLFHALIRDFYTASAYRIAGGSDCIAAALADSICGMGGVVRTRAQVSAINCGDAEVKSVMLPSGEEITGDYFISNLHPVRTMELLGGTHLLRKSYRARIGELQNTTACFTLHIKFKPHSMPYLNSNYYYLRCEDVWQLEDYTEQDFPRGILYMHECSALQQETADTASIIAYMRYSDVQRWAGTKVGRRGAEYEEFKERTAQRLLGALESQFPGTKRCIEAYYTSTPLTYQDYTATPQGSMYGILRDCTQPMQSIVSHRTKIPNLYYTGQNINMHGILGVIIGSVITASAFVGMENLMKQINEAQ